MSTNSTNWVGQLLCGGRYHVTKLLGEGGMAIVYLAHDRKVKRDVVIKVPHVAMLRDTEFAKRFEREVRLLVNLEDQRIVKVLDVDKHDGIPFVVLQYLPGGNLRDAQLKAGRGQFAPLKPEGLRAWLPQIAATLDFIHQKGYIHRDVKPDNILFDANHNVFLSDFGVAKALADGPAEKQGTRLTRMGMVVGTPCYMAPELHLGQPYDGRVDQYALAVTVFEFLSGRPPFEGTTPASLVVEQTKRSPPPLDELAPAVPRGLAAAVQRALAVEPKHRYPSCAAFVQTAMQDRENDQPPSKGAITSKPNPPPRVPTVLEAGAEPVRVLPTRHELATDAASPWDTGDTSHGDEPHVRLSERELLRQSVFRRHLEILLQLHLKSRLNAENVFGLTVLFLGAWGVLMIISLNILDSWDVLKSANTILVCLVCTVELVLSAGSLLWLLPKYVFRKRAIKLKAHIQQIINEHPAELSRWQLHPSTLEDPVAVEELINLLRKVNA